MSGQSPPPGQSEPSTPNEEPAGSSSDNPTRNLDPVEEHQEVLEQDLHDTAKEDTTAEPSSPITIPYNKPYQQQQQQQQQQTQDQQPKENPGKIEVLFKNTGNAPIMKKPKWAVSRAFTISDIVNFIRKMLKIEPSQSIFIYVNQSFAPPLDQTMQNLFDCYECDKKLVLYYATSAAWG